MKPIDAKTAPAARFDLPLVRFELQVHQLAAVAPAPTTARPSSLALAVDRIERVWREHGGEILHELGKFAAVGFGIAAIGGMVGAPWAPPAAPAFAGWAASLGLVACGDHLTDTRIIAAARANQPTSQVR